MGGVAFLLCGGVARCDDGTAAGSTADRAGDEFFGRSRNHDLGAADAGESESGENGDFHEKTVTRAGWFIQRKV